MAKLALQQELESQLPVDLRASIQQSLRRIRTSCSDEFSYRAIQQVDLMQVNGKPSVVLDQQVLKGRWNEHLTTAVPTIPLGQVEAYVRARSQGVDEATVRDRVRRTIHLLEHRTHGGMGLSEALLARLAEVTKNLVPTPRGGRWTPEHLHGRRIYVGDALFLMAYRSRLDGGNFYLTILALCKATGWFSQHHRLDLATAYESFRKNILGRTKVIFPVLTDADGQVVQEKVKEYANQRHGMNIYTRSEAAQELVDLLGPLPAAEKRAPEISLTPVVEVLETERQAAVA